MANAKRRQLASTVNAIQLRYGEKALRKASDLPIERIPPHIATGFVALDAITGCQGVPVGGVTLFSGQMTSGKLTVAYKTLANAQPTGKKKKRNPTTAILDLSRSCDPDYLARCGIDLDQLLIVHNQPDQQVIPLLLDLLQSRQFQVILVDSLTDLTHDYAALRAFNAGLQRLNLLLQNSPCALLMIDEPSPVWQRWLSIDSSWAVRQMAALHIELRRECWLDQADKLVGYQATATVRKSRWAPSGRSAPVNIVFNGTVKAQDTW